mgnify:CR=1 FL=1|jgi:hypothetical protein
MKASSRNHPLGFADRTWKNLESIETSYAQGVDVHMVTQLANSLLGLVVFPQQRFFRRTPTRLLLKDLEAQGWPSWSVAIGRMKSLDDLIRHLRNATAHGRLGFTSESRRLEEVSLVAEDVDPSTQKIVWKATISGVDLRQFCLLLTQLLREAGSP